MKNDGRIQESAEELHLHRNTMRYRLDRIREILGVSLENGETLFNLYLSIKILRVLQVFPARYSSAKR
ncbi:MAG: helix-turn-helix domain-containing protein [Synergistetes bacterium]|nr:helix-turn-helix domain-containing protein [Synergistota bacterium]